MTQNGQFYCMKWSENQNWAILAQNDQNCPNLAYTEKNDWNCTNLNQDDRNRPNLT